MIGPSPALLELAQTLVTAQAEREEAIRVVEGLTEDLNTAKEEANLTIERVNSLYDQFDELMGRSREE